MSFIRVMDCEEHRQQQLQQIIFDIIDQRSLDGAQRVKYLEKLQFTVLNDFPDIVLQLLKTECDIKVLVFFCTYISRYGDQRFVKPLIDCLLGDRDFKDAPDPLKHHKEDYVRARCLAIKSLGKLQSQEAVIPLMYVLNDKTENYRIRLEAAEALGHIGDSYALNPLINLVADDKENSVYLRESAAKALGMMGDVRAIQPLVKVLESKRGIMDKFTFLKERVIESVRKISSGHDKDTVRALKNSLLDDAPSVRLSAVEALVDIGDQSVIRVLIPVVYDEDEDVSREAVRGVFQLGGNLELNQLLEDDKLPGWSRDEIEMLFNEE